MKQLIAFDLDGTLAESKQPIGKPMARLLGQLLAVADVAVISGGDWPQFRKQVVSRLPAGADLTRLYIMPTTGTKLYRFEDKWRVVYADIFDKKERAAIIAALDAATAKAGLDKGKTWGERIEDRGSQITFSGLGQEAPNDAKKAWDPDFAKRKALQKTLRKLLPELSINVGGSTSIDITRQGIDKAYGMRRLAEHSGVAPAAMLFMGDAIYPGATTIRGSSRHRHDQGPRSRRNRDRDHRDHRLPRQITPQATPTRSCRRLRGVVVGHPVDTGDLVDDTRRDADSGRPHRRIDVAVIPSVEVTARSAQTLS